MAQRSDAKENSMSGELSFWSRPRKGTWSDDGCGDEEAERLAREVIGAAIEVHRVVGPGMPESVYEKALSRELTLRSIEHVRQAPVPVHYKGALVGEGQLDLLIGGRLVVELKACERLADVHHAQVLAYLCATDLRLGLLINFNVARLADGIRRIVNSF
jgi:GxxExxY protein